MECKLCGNQVDSVAHIAEQWLLDEIRAKNPEWVAEDGGCEPCLQYYRNLDSVVKIVDSDSTD